jgi:hypothetical protein
MRGIGMIMKIFGKETLFFLVFLMALWSCPLAAAEKPVSGTITELDKEVYVVRGEHKTAAKTGEKLNLGDSLQTGADGTATYTFIPGKSLVKLNHESIFFSDEKWKVPFYTLDQGQVRAFSSGLDKKLSIYCGDAFISGSNAEVDIACLEKGDFQIYVVSGKIWWEHTKFCTKKIVEKGGSVLWNAQGIPTVTKEKAQLIRERAQWIPFEEEKP